MKIYFLAATAANKDLTIFDKFDNLKQFVAVDGLTDITDTVTNSSTNVKQHTRKPYMRAKSSSTVSSHGRDYMVDTGRRKGNALPGQNFTLSATLTGSGEELRSFTYDGRMMDLHAYLKANVTQDTVLYGSTGARYSELADASGD